MPVLQESYDYLYSDYIAALNMIKLLEKERIELLERLASAPGNRISERERQELVRRQMEMIEKKEAT